MSPKIINKEEKKKEILNAAKIVFAQKGFASVRMIDVAEEAEIGKGTIYEYFRSKDDIIYAFYKEMKEDFLRLVTLIEKEPSALMKVQKYVYYSLMAFEQWKEMCYILLDFWAVQKSGGAPDINFEELYNEIRRHLARIIKDGIKKGEFRKVNPAHTASMLIALIDGLLLQWVFHPQSFKLKRISEDILSVVLRGLQK